MKSKQRLAWTFGGAALTGLGVWRGGMSGALTAGAGLVFLARGLAGRPFAGYAEPKIH